MQMRLWLLLAVALALPVHAEKPILIGEISSYSTVPAFTLPYRNGWALAVEEINGAGGLLGGRKLEVISRDDGGKPPNPPRPRNQLLDTPQRRLPARACPSLI